MASSSATGNSGLVAGSAGHDGFMNAIRCSWDPPHTNAGGVVNRIQYCRRAGDDSLFTDSLCPEWPDRRRIFNQYRFDGWNVARRRYPIVVQVLAFTREELFHQRHPQTLGHATLDLTLNQSR